MMMMNGTKDVVMLSSRKPVVLSVIIMLLLGGLPQVWAQGRSAKIDPAFNAFWTKFKAAVARSDKGGVADRTKLPFMIESTNLDRAGFIKQYGSLFTPRVRRCFARAKPTKDRDAYEIFCGQQIFLFGKVEGVYKFTEIGVND
jgi:hypothetical protein